MRTTTTARISDIEDAVTARWLTKALEAARLRVRTGPDTATVGRIRARVFGDAASRKSRRSIAA